MGWYNRVRVFFLDSGAFRSNTLIVIFNLLQFVQFLSTATRGNDELIPTSEKEKKNFAKGL